VKKDVTAPQKLVKLYNLNGEYDKAIDLLKTHHFRTWEGGMEIHSYYVDALALKGLELSKTGQYKDAIAVFNEALLYPENLEVGKPLNDDRAAMLWYFIGQAYEKSGQKSQAKEMYTKSTKANNGWTQDLTYYQAKSYDALGQTDKAKELFNDLIKRGENIFERGAARTGIGVEEATVEDIAYSQAFMLQALGYSGLGDATKAKELFTQSLNKYNNNLWAKYYLSFY